MESVSAVVFIGAVIVGLTEFIKALYDRDTRKAGLIVTAAVVGGFVGAFDTSIGVVNITVAQGVMYGLAATGAYTTAKQIG